MEENLSEIARPLQVHYNYINAILSRRHGDIDLGYTKPLNNYDYTAGEIFYHGINGLYRTIKTYYNPETNFNDHNVERDETLTPKNELMKLYVETTETFIELLQTIPPKDKDKIITSPISGNKVTLLDWFSTTVMHTIHHIGQSLRIHGMVLRKELNLPVERKETPTYRVLY